MWTRMKYVVPGARILGSVTIALIFAGGCTLPRTGPMLEEITAASDRNEIELTLISSELAKASQEPASAEFPDAFRKAQLFDYERFGVGDGIEISILERDGLGIFPVTQNGISSLGELVVDKSGAIQIPYVGRLEVKGMTPGELRAHLIQKLRNIVIASDVLVRLTERRGQVVLVQGDVGKPGGYPIALGTQRLSGVLGLALPNQENPEQLEISIRRGGVSAAVRLADVYNHPEDDVALQPGDLVIVRAVVKRLTVLGATDGQGRVRVSKRNYSVIDALADARGLSDNTASPEAVFLFRQPLPLIKDAQSSNPVLVYQFDFRNPEHLALAGQFTVRDGDSIYISNAPFAQVRKLLSVFSATLSGMRSTGLSAQ